MSKTLYSLLMVLVQPRETGKPDMQGFPYLSEGGARGLLNLGKKAFGPSNLEN